MYCLAQQAREKRQRALSNGDASSSSSETESSDEADEVSVKIAERIPELFKDPGYAQLGHSTLSTSNCGNVSLRLFGFGPVVGDGLGIGYIIKVRARSLPLSPLSPSLLPLYPPSRLSCSLSPLPLPLFASSQRADCTLTSSSTGRLDLGRRLVQAPPDAAVPRRAPGLLRRSAPSPQAAAPGSDAQAQLGALAPPPPHPHPPRLALSTRC